MHSQDLTNPAPLSLVHAVLARLPQSSFEEQIPPGEVNVIGHSILKGKIIADLLFIFFFKKDSRGSIHL